MVESKLLIVFSVFALIVFSASVIAAGGGGGGSVGTSSDNCVQDTWTCTDWTPCAHDKTQTRNCTMTYDCPGVTTAQPFETASCKYVSKIVSDLKCQNLNTTRDRVACRLGLTQADLANELQIAYLPEECRQIDDTDKKDACVNIYAQSQKCWHFDIGPEREQCLRTLLNVGDIMSQKNDCKIGPDLNNTCYTALKNNVYTLVKFRIYDLEERAEDMINKGLINKDQAADIITQLENDKIAFNNANNKNARIAALNAAKTHWATFIDGVRKMKISAIILMILVLAMIAGCTQQAPVNNPPPVNQTDNVTVAPPVVVPEISYYANTSGIDEGINELNQVE